MEGTDRQYTPRGMAYHNPDPGPIPEGAPRTMVKSEFGNRLHRLILLAGMNQSEFARRASEVMTRNPITIARDTLAVAVLNTLERQKITSVVVVDEDHKVLGVVHLHDLWRTEMI